MVRLACSFLSIGVAPGDANGHSSACQPRLIGQQCYDTKEGQGQQQTEEKLEFLFCNWTEQPVGIIHMHFTFRKAHKLWQSDSSTY